MSNYTAVHLSQLMEDVPDAVPDVNQVEIAKAHGVGVGQVVLRWHLQGGRTVLPESSIPERMRQDLDLFGFEPDDEQMRVIGALGTGEARRTCPDPASVV